MFDCEDLISEAGSCDESVTTVNEQETFSEATRVAMLNLSTKNYEE